MKTRYQVIIIGAGPAGIGAATALYEAGVRDFIVLDREAVAGGVPRHCQHLSFGIKTCYRPMSGPSYLKKILARVPQEAFITNASVVAIKPDGEVLVSTDQGLCTLSAERIILATGARETPRHPRLVSGLRPQGIMTTGALQQMVYLRHVTPCRAPVIVGTELVSFSAFWTLRSLHIRPRAMIESNSRPSTWQICRLLPTFLGTPVYCASKITEIGGLERVEYVEIEHTESGKKQRIACDSVIFTGKFVGEYTLVRHSHLEELAQTGCPITDQFGRCSDPTYFATGNMLHPVDTGEQCYQEGLRVGNYVGQSLRGALPSAAGALPFLLRDPRLRVVMPSQLVLTEETSSFTLHLRTSAYFSGEIVVRCGTQILYRQHKRCLSEQGLILKNIARPNSLNPVELAIIENS